MESAEIGIFGGTGLYDAAMIKGASEVEMQTPYGKPSDVITVGEFAGRRVAFLPRHGKKHSIPPHMINFRANIWAFKEMGITRIISPSAVGSLTESMEPGHMVVPDQYIDMTRTRAGTFADLGKVSHVSMADPFCPQLRRCVTDEASNLGLKCHDGGTYVCIEGPRFSTRAESRLFRSWQAQIIGMTLVPECQLAREARICYASVSSVTDYDVWADKPVTASEVMRTLSENSKKTRELLAGLVGKIPGERRCGCASAMDDAQL